MSWQVDQLPTKKVKAAKPKEAKPKAAKLKAPKPEATKPKVTKPKVASVPELEKVRQRILDLERELQYIKLEHEETKSALLETAHDLNLQNKQAAESKEREIRDRFKTLFQDLAGPVAQLLTQDHIQNVQGKTLNAKDVQAISNRLIQGLRNHGLEISEEVGSVVLFNETKHEPLTLDDTIEEGDQVIVRMCAVSFEGKVLRRAAISKPSKSD
jgi:molecular chaperone GrpE (heat shock protein)